MIAELNNLTTLLTIDAPLKAISHFKSLWSIARIFKSHSQPKEFSSPALRDCEVKPEAAAIGTFKIISVERVSK